MIELIVSEVVPFQQETEASIEVVDDTVTKDGNELCPNCHEELYITGHCKTCLNCFWASCSL